eukprot:GSMAST32.ASY1.ANO1.47.1 assembled CDS
MDSTATTLFPASATAGADNSLVKFKAGKMSHTKVAGENKYKVVSDHTKGFVFMERDVSGLMHLKWCERDSLTVAPGDDQVVIAGDQTFKKVETGVASDRVYLLQYKNSSRRFFYWMQEPDSTKDEANVKKLCELIGQTEAAAPTSSLQSILAGMTSTASNDSTSTTDSVASLNNDALALAMAEAMGQMQVQHEEPVPLQDILRHPDVTTSLQTPEMQNELVSLLPEGLQTTEELENSLRTPQLQQAVGRLSGALQSSNINTVMVNFNLDPAAGADHLARGDGVGAFIAAVQQQADAEKEDSEEEAMDEKE